MKIIHAVCNEAGKASGGEAGDQTGREIRESSWYLPEGGWTQYLECTDRSLAARAVANAKALAAGNYGYSREARWSGYDSVLKNGILNGCGDFDCSSLVLSCYRLAGLPIKEKSGSTRDLAKRLTDTGKFILHESGDVLSNPDLARKGSLYCTPGAHVVICIEDGKDVEPEGEEELRSYVRAKGSVRIREVPKTGKTIAIAHKGDLIEVFGQDAETGWYQCACGYVTNNKRYVEECC